MSENVGTIYYEVDADTAPLVKSTAVAEKQLGQTEQAMRRTDRAAGELTSGLGALATAIKAVIAANALRSIAGLVQGYQEMADRVRLATDSTAEFEAVQARLVQTANGTYRSLAEAQELFIGTAGSLRAMGYTTQQALDVTDSLSYSFVTNAVNADRAKAATEAFAKSMAKGKVDADNWLTISTTVDTVVGQLAETTGKTTGEILAMGAAGKIAARDLSEALRKSLDDNAKAAAAMSNNLTDAATRMTTALTAVFVEVENQTGAWQALTDGIIKAADWILETAGNADRMKVLIDGATTAVTALAAVVAGRLLTSLGSYVAQQAILITTLVRQAAAERVAATAALATAQAQKAAALSSAERTRAIAAEAAAQQRLNAVTTAGAVAARGLGAAMSFLGGPVGVVLLAATAIAAFSSNAAAAKGPVEGLAEAVGTLGTRALELQKIQLMEKIQQMGDLGGAASNSAARIETLQKNLAEFPNSAKATEWTRELAEQRAAAEAAGGELSKFQQRVKDVEQELANRKAGITTPSGEPTLNPVVDTAADDAAAKKRAQAMEQNAKAVEDLARANEQASMSGAELAQSMALASLNEFATPDQIARVKQLSQAIFDKNELVKAAAEEEKKAAALQKAAIAADPRTAAADKYAMDLAAYQEFKNAQLITDQQYEELKNASATEYEAQRLAAQEQMFAAQSRGNALIIDTLNNLQSTGAQVFTGLVTGATDGEQAVQALAGAVLNQAVSAMFEWGVAQVKAIIMGQSAQAAATAAGIAQGAALASAYGPAAIAASIASFGAAPVAATSSMAANVPAMTALLAVGGRRHGGPVEAGSMYRVNEGGKPEVFNAGGQQYMIPNQRGEVVSNKDATAGSDGAAAAPNISVNLIESADRGGEVQPNDQGGMDIFVAQIRNGGDAARVMESTYGLKRVGR
ncbi:hypothetical protein D3C77_106020 [compost metagenome]